MAKSCFPLRPKSGPSHGRGRAQRESQVALQHETRLTIASQTLLAALPDMPTARYLADTYFENAAWMYHPITKEYFFEVIFSRIYPDMGSESPVDVETDRDTGSYESHRLAILFIILAVGILVDSKRPSHDPEAIHYFQLSKAALSIKSILEEPSITAIQALVRDPCRRHLFSRRAHKLQLIGNNVSLYVSQ